MSTDLPPQEIHRRKAFPLSTCLLGCLVPILALAALATPVFITARDAARSASCYANGNYLYGALSMYAADYDDRLPPASRWSDLIRPYTKLSRDVDCPSRPNAIGPHAFNKALDRALTAKVNDQAPLLFESAAGRRNYADLLESFTRPHMGKGQVVLGGGAVRAFETPPDAKFGN